MDVENIKLMLHDSFLSTNSLQLLQIQNHIYGCFVLLEDIAQKTQIEKSMLYIILQQYCKPTIYFDRYRLTYNGYFYNMGFYSKPKFVQRISRLTNMYIDILLYEKFLDCSEYEKNILMGSPHNNNSFRSRRMTTERGMSFVEIFITAIYPTPLSLSSKIVK